MYHIVHWRCKLRLQVNVQGCVQSPTGGFGTDMTDRLELSSVLSRLNVPNRFSLSALFSVHNCSSVSCVLPMLAYSGLKYPWLDTETYSNLVEQRTRPDVVNIGLYLTFNLQGLPPAKRWISQLLEYMKLSSSLLNFHAKFKILPNYYLVAHQCHFKLMTDSFR